MAPVQFLRGLRVVDFSVGIAGPYCAKLFADAGADVTRVETDDADWLRSYVPEGAVCREVHDGALFQYINCGKRAISGADSAAVQGAVAESDLLIVDADSGQNPGQLRARHPRTVVVSLSPFGLTGPFAGRRGSELVVQAESGAMKFKGRPDRPPVQAGGWIGQFLVGASAAVPALAALRQAQRTQVGELIDVACIDVLAVAGSNFSSVLYELQGRPGCEGVSRYVDSPGIETTADGLVAVNANSGQMFENFLLLIGRGDLIGNETFSNLRSRLARLPDWQAMIDEVFAGTTTDDIVKLATDLRVPVARIHDGASVLNDEQLSTRGVFVRRGDDSPLSPRTPFQVREVAAGREPARSVPGQGARDTGEPVQAVDQPLSGVRVVDLTSWWVGAAATQALAFLGAEVIHVESVAHPDGMRLTGGSSGDGGWWERGHMFLAANTNKLGLTLDLDTEEGQDLMRRLITQSDMLVENFTPRVADRWHLTEEEVLEVNPSIVYMRMPAFGLTGPWRDRPAFAQTIEPMSTMAVMTGYPDDLPLAKGGMADAAAGMHGGWAAMVGLWHHQQTGLGMTIEATMIEAALNVAAQSVVESDAYGVTTSRRGNRSPLAAPQGVYPCIGSDEWVAITVDSDSAWAQLQLAMGSPAWASAPELATLPGRQAAHDLLDQQITEWTRRQTPEALQATLVQHDVAAGLCWDPRLLPEHPQLRHRGLYQSVDHAVVGPHRVPGPPYRCASMRPREIRPAPTLGQDNRSVLGDLLGLDDRYLDTLERRGIIGTTPQGY